MRISFRTYGFTTSNHFLISVCSAVVILTSCGGSQTSVPPLRSTVLTMARGPQEFRPNLSCSPAPCALPNVQVSEGGNVVAETPMIANPRDSRQLLAGSVDFNCGYPSSKWPAGTGIYASNDGGQTWNHSCLQLAANAVGTEWDPSVAYDLNGAAFASGPEGTSTLYAEDVVTKSTDHGHTWSTPVAVPTVNPNAYVDRPWLEVDTSPSSPRKNDLYVSESEFYGLDTIMTASHSHDGGSTWTTVAVSPSFSSPNQIDGGNAVVGKDGTVYVLGWECTFQANSCGGTVETNLLYKSIDGGKTWSSGRVVDKPTLAPNSCHCTSYGSLPGTNVSVADIPMMAVDNSTGPRAGTLYVVDFSWAHNSFMQVRLLSSSNGGKTWSKPLLLAPKSDTHDQFFPWVSVSSKGIVGVTWLDRRNDPHNLLYEEFGAVSSDGVHFPNHRIAAKPSDPRKGWNGSFIGDFTGGAWAGKTLYAAWPDTNNKSKNLQDMVGGIEVP